MLRSDNPAVRGLRRRFVEGARAAVAPASIFLFALAVRLLWVGLVESPFDNIWSDMGGYVQRALQAAYGKGDPAPQFVSLYPPGTHWILAAQMLVIGWKRHAAFLLFHCMWGALVAPCMMLLAERIVRPRWIAIAFGVLVAVWQPLLAFSGYFSSEQFDAALLAMSSWLLVRHVETGRNAIALGVSTALAYLVRPPVLVTVAMLGVIAVVMTVRRPAGPPRLRPWRLTLALSILAVTVALGAVRYHSITGHYGLISDNGAMARFFADTDYGKVRSSDQGYFFEPPAKVQAGERRELLVTGYVGQPAALELARAKEVQHMTKVARIRRFAWNVSLLFVGNDLWPENAHLGARWRRVFNDVAKNTMLAVVCPLALLGALSCAWRRRPALVVAVAQVLTALVVAGLYFGECRYRVPWDGFFLLLALEGGQSLVLVGRAGLRAIRAHWQARAGGAPALQCLQNPGAVAGIAPALPPCSPTFSMKEWFV
jgi:hypothetical protein